VSDGWKIKVCDFGLAKGTDMREEGKPMTICGTNEWMAPEVMCQEENYGHKCDVFSYGCVLYELITRNKPPQRQPRNAYAFQHIESRPAQMNRPALMLWKILEECTQRDALSRPEFADVCSLLDKLRSQCEEAGWEEESSHPTPDKKTKPTPKSGSRGLVNKEKSKSSGKDKGHSKGSNKDSGSKKKKSK